MLTILGIGLILDLVAPAGPDLGAYKLAFSVQYLFWLGGGLAMLRNRRLARRVLIGQGR